MGNCSDLTQPREQTLKARRLKNNSPRKAFQRCLPFPPPIPTEFGTALKQDPYLDFGPHQGKAISVKRNTKLSHCVPKAICDREISAGTIAKNAMGNLSDC